jgi:hypothetical protein
MLRVQIIAVRTFALRNRRRVARIKTSLTILRPLVEISGPSAHELVTDNLLAISAPDMVSSAQGGRVEKRHLIRRLSRLIF